jgi:cellulose synthase operon protein C
LLVGGGVAAAIAGGALLTRTRTKPLSPATTTPSLNVDAGALDGVRFSGCASVTRDGVCEVGPPGVLRIWAAGSASDLEVALDGTPTRPTSRDEVLGGTRVAIAPAAAKELRVSVGARAFVLALLPARPRPESVRVATELRNAAKLDEARALLEADRGRAEQAGEGGAVIGLLARVALAEGRDADVDALFDASIRLNEAAGRYSEAADDAFALVFSLLSRVRIADAKRVLTRAEALSRGYPDGMARVRYYGSLILSMSSQSREALRECRLAEEETDRLGLARLGRMARQHEAAILDDLGRVSDSLAILDEQYRTSQAEMEPCDLADLIGFRGIVATHARDVDAVDARGWLVRAIELYRSRCPASYDPARVANLEGYLARAEVRTGRLADAEKHLRASVASMAHPHVEVLLDRLLTQAELAFARHASTASLAAWDEMAAHAQEIGNDDFLRLALDGRARVLAAMGRDEDALASLERAGAVTDRLLVRIPIGEGRESYAAEQERDDARRIELLVRMNRAADAMRELVKVRARMLSSLEDADRLGSLAPAAANRWLAAVGDYRREREALEVDAALDWKLSAESLRAARVQRSARADAARTALDAALARVLHEAVHAPDPFAGLSDATLGLLPTEHGWLGFFSVGATTRAVSLGVVEPTASPEALAKALLEPFRAELSAAPRLAVVAFGAARAVDVHALPWDDAPLVAKMPVVYPIGRAAPPSARVAPGGVLVVGDPTSDLPGARREIDDVTASLRARGEARITVLVGTNATGAAVRVNVADARLFHYAGHGRFAGRDGWLSALPLAEHGELSVPDILSLAHAPEHVVLLGCETARTSDGAQAEGLGLAQAFLVAGSRAVIASMRTVDDAAAGAMARALYAHLGPGTDLAEALRAAQVEEWKRGASDYGAFRVLLP